MSLKTGCGNQLVNCTAGWPEGVRRQNNIFKGGWFVFCPAGLAGGTTLNVRFGKTFADLPSQQFFIIRLVTTAGDEPLHGVQQLQPVFQRRFLDRLPGVEPLEAVKKLPITAHVLHVDLQFLTIFGHAFPGYFGFGHFKGYSGRLMLATAIAAMPSSRPTKPMVSFVVALTPICFTVTPRAVAMRCFISAMCG